MLEDGSGWVSWADGWGKGGIFAGFGVVWGKVCQFSVFRKERDLGFWESEVSREGRYHESGEFHEWEVRSDE